MRQIDDLAMRIGEQVHGREDRRAQLLLGDAIRRVVGVRLERRGVLGVEAEVGDLALLESRQADVFQDAIKPRVEALLEIKAVDRPVGANERLLGRVFGPDRVAQDAACDPGGARGVVANDRFEGVTVTLLTGGYRRRFGGCCLVNGLVTLVRHGEFGRNQIRMKRAAQISAMSTAVVPHARPEGLESPSFSRNSRYS